MLQTIVIFFFFLILIPSIEVGIRPLEIMGQNTYNSLKLIAFCKPAELDKQVSMDEIY